MSSTSFSIRTTERCSSESITQRTYQSLTLRLYWKKLKRVLYDEYCCCFHSSSRNYSAYQPVSTRLVIDKVRGRSTKIEGKTENNSIRTIMTCLFSGPERKQQHQVDPAISWFEQKWSSQLCRWDLELMRAHEQLSAAKSTLWPDTISVVTLIIWYCSFG